MIFKLEPQDNHIFRITIELSNNIEEKYLSQSLTRTLKTFKSFKKKITYKLLKKTLEENNKEIIIHKTITNQITEINTKDNNEHLIRISYEKNFISIDIDHILTDGFCAKYFIEELLYNYLRLTDHKLKPQEKLMTTEENAYKKYNIVTNKLSLQSYKVEGKNIPNKNIYSRNFSIEFQEIQKLSQKHSCTNITTIISMIIYSLLPIDNNKTLSICIPTNLRKYYETNTTSSFISNPILELNPSSLDSLDKIISIVKEQYELTEHKVYNIYNNITTTIYNIGTIKIKDEYETYINKISFELLPNIKENINIATSIFKDRINICFTSNIVETNIEENLKKILEDNNIKTNDNTYNKFD